MPRPRLKRLFRISLRGLLFVVTVLCVLLAFKVRQVERQKEVVAWVQDSGGTVGYDYEFHDGWPTFRVKSPGPQWLVGLIGADYFRTVVRVDLHTSFVTDVSPLVKLTSLESLTVDASQLSPLANVMNLTNLNQLVLPATPSVVDEEVPRIKRALPNCRIECYYLQLKAP